MRCCCGEGARLPTRTLHLQDPTSILGSKDMRSHRIAVILASAVVWHGALILGIPQRLFHGRRWARGALSHVASFVERRRWEPAVVVGCVMAARPAFVCVTGPGSVAAGCRRLVGRRSRRVDAAALRGRGRGRRRKQELHKELTNKLREKNMPRNHEKASGLPYARKAKRNRKQNQM